MLTRFAFLATLTAPIFGAVTKFTQKFNKVELKNDMPDVYELWGNRLGKIVMVKNYTINSKPFQMYTIINSEGTTDYRIVDRKCISTFLRLPKDPTVSLDSRHCPYPDSRFDLVEYIGIATGIKKKEI